MSTAEDARKSHEAKHISVYRQLRDSPLVATEWQSEYGGRLAPAIDVLRNRYGFVISGQGTFESPYILESPNPTLCPVTEAMKLAYYQTRHWRHMRETRLMRDHWECVACGSDKDLQVHHITYDRLFSERLTDLLTVCEHHHKMIHNSCDLAFPAGVPFSQAIQMGSDETPSSLLAQLLGD